MSTDREERTVLVLVERPLHDLDTWFADLEKQREGGQEGRGRTFEQTPSHQQGDVVLLGSWGKRGSGNLYVFVGQLRGCRHDGKSLCYTTVERFSCPVTATYGDHLHREDLLGDREGWGANPFNYVLPVALSRVPQEAEALLRHDPRADMGQRERRTRCEQNR